MFGWIFTWLLLCIHFVNCGKDKQTLRIVGGQEVHSIDLPYQVSITRSGRFICGGSIIAQRFILTAAHCVSKDAEPSHYIIRAGSDFAYQGGTVHQVTRIIPHEKYLQEKGNIKNDIALLEISPLIMYDSKHQRIKLYSSKDVIPAGTVTLVSGFGKPSETEKATQKMAAVNLPIIDWNYCHNYYKREKINLSEDFICAGVPKNDKNSCQGDSGGPIVIGKIQVGIVSWGVGCTKPGYPGVYTNVAYFVDWIKKKIAESENHPGNYDDGHINNGREENVNPIYYRPLDSAQYESSIPIDYESPGFSYPLENTYQSSGYEPSGYGGYGSNTNNVIPGYGGYGFSNTNNVIPGYERYGSNTNNVIANYVYPANLHIPLFSSNTQNSQLSTFVPSSFSYPTYNYPQISYGLSSFPNNYYVYNG